MDPRNPTSLPRPFADLPPAALARVRGVFTDIDDTLSTSGKLTPEAYSALWRLKEAGLRVIPVTGRPAGWCDHIARFWPVDAVVGENGAFYFHHDGAKLRRRFIYSEPERAEFRRKLDAIRDRVLAEVPGCALASDQPYREADLAIDFREDVPPLPMESIQRIKAIFEEHGATAKISSIHVNGWFGAFDKLSTARLCVRELWNEDLDATNESWLFLGDSPNDEPMFEFFRLSAGVANLREFLGQLRRPPGFITEGEAGTGFAEAADRLLAARGATIAPIGAHQPITPDGGTSES